jgi:insertion element IS1 protein InsB
VDRRPGRTLAWVRGGRDGPTCQRRYATVTHWTPGLFDTDAWDTVAQGLPQARHRTGKAQTHAIERAHSHTRHPLARMTRRTTVVSQSEALSHAS